MTRRSLEDSSNKDPSKPPKNKEKKKLNSTGNYKSPNQT